MSNPTQQPRDICERTLGFALRVFKVIKELPSDVLGQVIARQLGKSGTSIGANVEEAQGSHSKAKFSRRMGIARSEARESNYWLRLIAESSILPKERLSELINESDELIRILTVIVKKTRKK